MCGLKGYNSVNVYLFSWAPAGFFPGVGELGSEDQSPTVGSRDPQWESGGPQKPTTGGENNA